jgi:phage-related protein
MLPEKWIDSAYISNHPVVHMEYLKVDCKIGEKGMIDDEEVEALTEEQCYQLMREAAQARYDTDHADEVKVELKVSFIHLGDTEEYRQYRDMETLHLYDRVLIHDTPIGLRATAQVKSFVWNCLTERYESITLGDVFDTLGSSIAGYDLDRECVRYEKLHRGTIKQLRSGLATSKELKETNDSLQSTMYTANTATRNITAIIDQLRTNYQIDINL